MLNTGGQLAVKTGKQLESSIDHLIASCGYKFVSREIFSPMKGMEQPIYTQQYDIGKGIYGKPREADFILYHPNRWQHCLVIEAKWQQSGGSVEEKYPFLVLCIQASSYESIVVLDGGGYTDGAEAWLKRQEGSGYLKKVMDLRLFQIFANDGHL